MTSERRPKPGKWTDSSTTFVIHEDIQKGLMEYKGKDGDSLSQVFEQRKQLTESGEVYWNTDHDAEMLETARERSQDPRFIEYCKKHNITF